MDSVHRLSKRLEEVMAKFSLPNLQDLGLYRTYCNVKDLEILTMRHKARVQSFNLLRVEVSGGISHWRSLFTLIHDRLPTLRLSRQRCTRRGLILYCRMEHKGGENHQEISDVGRNSEEWITAIQVTESRTERSSCVSCRNALLNN
jgi:hypothetical protein